MGSPAPPPPTEGDAVILAGGLSRRMGRDKALVEFEGETLLSRTLGALRRAFSRVHLSIDPARPYPQVEAPRIPDAAPGLGPLEGVRASLAALGAPALFAAVDLPVLSRDLAVALFREVEEGRLRGAVPRWRGGLEPAFAAYSPELLEEIRALLSSGRRGLRELAELEGVAVLDLEDAEVQRRVFGGPPPPLDRLFRNLNTPADLGGR